MQKSKRTRVETGRAASSSALGAGSGGGAASSRVSTHRSGLVIERTGARAARIAAGTARPRGRGGGRAALCGYGKHRKLGCELLALTFRAGCFVLAENKRFKLVLAFLANVLEDRHGTTPDGKSLSLFKIRWWILRNHLRSQRPSCHAVGCAADTCRPWPAS